jgi:hypothetical protein
MFIDTDITFYKNGLMYVGDLLKPTGTSVIAYTLWDDFAAGLCGGYPQVNCWYMKHDAIIDYGIWHYNSNPPEEL